jgi:hypothetical protein
MATEDAKESNAWGNAQDRAKESRASKQTKYQRCTGVVHKTWEGKARRPGKPDAVKAARPVWEGIIGNVITTVRMWITRAGYLLHRLVDGRASIMVAEATWAAEN